MSERIESLIREARRALGVKRLAFCIHDASFPAGDADVGRGTPYSESAFALAGFVASLGFDILQLGPQGETSPGNPSPYDSAAFSRSTLSIAAAALSEPEAGELLSAADLAATLEGAVPDRTVLRADDDLAWGLQRRLLARAFRRFRDSSRPLAEGLGKRAADFARRNAEWLARDGLYDALSERHHGCGFEDWPEAERRLLAPQPREVEAFRARRRGLEAMVPDALAFHRFSQWIAAEQHDRLRRRAKTLGLRIYGDLQIGLADRDVWALQSLLLPEYRLGAPPSRTNPSGQPWGYRVFHPDAYEDPDGEPDHPADHEGRTPRSVTALLRRRLDLFFEKYDALRIDHPHGLVCPWIYRADEPDHGVAVRAGARLFSTGPVPDHPELARFDIARPEQIDGGLPPWADHWVTDLDPEQVDAYAQLFDEVCGAADRVGLGSSAILCEVLSTLPLPLERVLERHGLGRFRVTGKIDPGDPHDPYRVEAANVGDWVMLGTHDTPPIWTSIEGWTPARRRARAGYAAERLEPDADRRRDFAAALDREPSLLAQAMLAELFVGPAQNVMVFFSDLFGLTETYNRPGSVSPLNWSLRLPPDYRAVYAHRLGQHRALNLPLALALALRARGDAPGDLLRALFDEAGRAGPVPDLWRRSLA